MQERRVDEITTAAVLFRALARGDFPGAIKNMWVISLKSRTDFKITTKQHWLLKRRGERDVICNASQLQVQTIKTLVDAYTVYILIFKIYTFVFVKLDLINHIIYYILYSHTYT